MKVFFYGTLRKGGIFSRSLPEDRKITLCQLKGIRMYMLGQFPGVQVTNDKKDFVVGEVVDFEGILSQEEWDAMITNMDRIENTANGLFERSMIETPHGEAIIYLVTDDTLKVFGEDFKKYRDKDLEILTDWASVDPMIADMVPTLNKEKDNVTIRTAGQKD